jgi:accessory colonization factor AcfC
MAWELTKREEDAILQNSVERVINNSMDRALKNYNNPKDEDAGINYEDWEELKPIVTKLWNKARNEVFLKRNPPK